MGFRPLWTLLTGLSGLAVACAPKTFSKDPAYHACQNSGMPCVSANGRDHFTVDEKVAGGKVDILMVTDNSASMSYEQKKLADRFSGFIANLDSKLIDYRIGVITTDISSTVNPPREVNSGGKLQDGRLIAFPNGKSFLTADSGSLSQKDQAFKSTVQRPETEICENYIVGELTKCAAAGISKDSCIEKSAYVSGYNLNCPSGDERGIFAARLVLENNPSSFLRPDASLSIIALSDEDVRSALYRSPYSAKGETHMMNPSYPLTEKDSYQSFLNYMSQSYPTKSYSFHSITVPFYTDLGCAAIQAGQTGGVVGSSLGLQYENLAYQTRGVRGSVCDSSYTSTLQNIFNQLQGQILDKVALACENPPDLVVSVADSSGAKISPSWTLASKEVRFSAKLPVGSSLKVTYSCKTLD